MADFKIALKGVLETEGGYVDDRYDPGGQTKFGISKRSYPDLDIQSLTVEDAMRIYLTDWWTKYSYGWIDSQEIANKVLDMSVNMGPKPAHKIVQRAHNAISIYKLKVDGILGKYTLGKINSHNDAAMLHRAISHFQAKFYESLWTRVKKLTRFKRGWLRRAFL